MPLQDVHDTTAWLELALRPGVSPFAQRSLLRKFGSPNAAVRASAPEVAQACGAAAANAFTRGPRMAVVEATLRWLEHPGHWLVALGEDAYPPMLLHIAETWRRLADSSAEALLVDVAPARPH